MSTVPYEDFRRLYGEVTAVLRDFILEGFDSGEISADEVLWFEQMIGGFERKFAVWGTTSGAVDAYLVLFERNHISGPVRLAAHAFLHVAYDLPRVIADSLTAVPLPAANRGRLRSLFLRPAPLFRQVFLNHARAGHLGLLARPLGYLKAAEVLGYWLLSLRSVAWIHAETLADSPDRVRLEQQLADGLLIAGTAASRLRGIAAVPKLDNSVLFQAATPLMIGIDYPTTAAAIALGAATIVATASLFNIRNDAVTNHVRYFGARVYIEATKSMQSGESSPLSSLIR